MKWFAIGCVVIAGFIFFWQVRQAGRCESQGGIYNVRVGACFRSDAVIDLGRVAK